MSAPKNDQLTNFALGLSCIDALGIYYTYNYVQQMKKDIDMQMQKFNESIQNLSISLQNLNKKIESVHVQVNSKLDDNIRENKKLKKKVENQLDASLRLAISEKGAHQTLVQPKKVESGSESESEVENEHDHATLKRKMLERYN